MYSSAGYLVTLVKLVTSIQDEVTAEAFKFWTPSKQATSSVPMRLPSAVIVPSLLLLAASCASSITSGCLASQRRIEEAAQERIMSKPPLCLIHLTRVAFICHSWIWSISPQWSDQPSFAKFLWLFKNGKIPPSRMTQYAPYQVRLTHGSTQRWQALEKQGWSHKWQALYVDFSVQQKYWKVWFSLWPSWFKVYLLHQSRPEKACKPARQKCNSPKVAESEKGPNEAVSPDETKSVVREEGRRL